MKKEDQNSKMSVEKIIEIVEWNLGKLEKASETQIDLSDFEMGQYSAYGDVLSLLDMLAVK